ncbi:MAG: DnaA N-terminal domain-containing protein, partial [Candidatus Acidiferrales bacterium]
MSAWDKVLQQVERRVNPHSFATWFRPTQQESADSSKLLVRVPTRLFRKRLTETYGELLQAALNDAGLPDTRIEFVCSEA